MEIGNIIFLKLFFLPTLFRYFFVRTKTCKEAVRVSKFDSLVARLSKMLTGKVNQLIVAEVKFTK